MGVDIAVYRARIGNFNHIKVNFRVNLNRKSNASVFSSPPVFLCLIKVILFLLLPIVVSFSTAVVLFFLSTSFFHALRHQLKRSPHACSRLSNKDFLFLFSFFSLVVQLLLVVSGSVHVNPGPPPVRNKISFCCWNIDSLLTRDSAKIGLIEGLQSVHNFDIFGICESYLTDKTDPHDLIIDGFSTTPFRSDCKDTASRPRGGVCLYFKEHLPIINRTDLSKNIDETLVCEIRLRSKKIFIVLSYRPPSLNLSNQISDYCNKLSTLIESIRSHKPAAVVLMGDFNARSPLFWDGETVETAAGKKLSDFMMLNSLEQLIDEPTHFPRDDIATCIDLIFTDQAYAISDSGVIPSPDPKCKHQLIHGNIDFCVPCPLPISVLCGIMIRQMFKKYKRIFPLLIGILYSKIRAWMIASIFSTALS